MGCKIRGVHSSPQPERIPATGQAHHSVAEDYTFVAKLLSMNFVNVGSTRRPIAGVNYHLTV